MGWLIEYLAGTADGVNTAFTLSDVPFGESELIFSPSFALQKVTGAPFQLEYSRSGMNVTLGLAPLSQPWARYFRNEPVGLSIALSVTESPIVTESVNALKKKLNINVFDSPNANDSFSFRQLPPIIVVYDRPTVTDIFAAIFHNPLMISIQDTAIPDDAVGLIRTIGTLPNDLPTVTEGGVKVAKVASFDTDFPAVTAVPTITRVP